MKKVVVRYYIRGDEPRSEQTIVLGPADELRAKRELDGKGYVDDQYVLFYRTFLAGRRAKVIAEGISFDAWLETVEEVEPRISLEEVETGLRLGKLTEVEAELLREQIRALGDDPGESQTPRA